MHTKRFFERDTLTVARELIGTVLHVRGGDGVEVSGRIVECEAYRGEDDPASHAGRGRTPRSAIMFGPAGVLYVYLIYGMHHCLNFVTGATGTAGAVLIRAVEPVVGSGIMARRRGLDSDRVRGFDLCGGPGKLAQALDVDVAWNGATLKRSSGIWVCAGRPPATIETTPRIGIRQATDLPFRFIDPDSNCLSG